jgi:hypothetical protein
VRRLSTFIIIAAAIGSAPLRAQESSTIGAFELRPMAGQFIPTGPMRNDFRDAPLVGLQGGFEFSSNVHMLLGGFWSRNNSHFQTLSSNTVDLWQFDAGAEFNLIKPMGRDWFFRPFVGGGAGLRTYDYKAEGSRRCGATYGAAGAEAQRFEGAFRFEVRDYVTCYESPLLTTKKTRNDLGITLGFVYHIL